MSYLLPISRRTCILATALLIGASSAHASWWGPPSCDDNAIVDGVMNDVRLDQERKVVEPGNMGAVFMTEITKRHLTQLNTELVSTVETEATDQSRSCTMQMKLYPNSSEGEAIIEDMQNDDVLRRTIELTGQSPNSPIALVMRFWQEGFEFAVEYRTFYSDQGDPVYSIDGLQISNL